MILEGGCRGCAARGQWPGAKETVTHALHDCPPKNIRDLIEWKAAVIKHIKHILQYVREIGTDSHSLQLQVSRALGAATRRCPEGEGYKALRLLVGGVIEWWDANARHVIKNIIKYYKTR